MSIQTLYTAATGMEAMQTKLNVIANNLANVNTTGFKRDRANFEDLFYRQVKLPGLQDAQGQLTPTGIHLGLGTRVSSTQTEFVQGAFQDSEGELDMAIVGNGFFQVVDPNTSQILYTRAGNFSRNANGNIVMGSAGTGRLLEPAITIPQDAIAVSISDAGFVEVQLVGQPQLQQIGQIQLASFINPQGLLKLGENLYQETNASGPVLINNPGTNGVGTIKQRMLEASNVEPVRELIDLITTQRSFELNSQAIQVGDQMLQLVANLRRF
jgi:flagellar basal-body rod protein FlgG